MKLASVKQEVIGRRLVWNVLFYGGHIGVFVFGWVAQMRNEKLAILNLLKFSVWISRGAGLCLAIDGALLLLPVCRNIVCYVRPKLAGLIPLDENLWFHRQIAYSLLFWTIVHTTAHYVNMLNVERTQVRTETAVGIMYTQPGAFTGHVMILLMVFIYTTAHFKIRRQCFEAFWFTHHLALFWFICLWSHASGCFVRGGLPGEPVTCLGYNSRYYTWIAPALYFCERVWRVIRSRKRTEVVGVLLHPSGAMEVRFRKPSMKYVPGQWLYVNVPDVAPWQWHPFTISSAPDDPYISVHIRQVGDFTQALGERLGATTRMAAALTSQSKKGIEASGGAREPDFVDITDVSLQQGVSLPEIRIDGPFGAPAEDVFRSEVAVLVGAGIGVTPFSSILKNIYHKQQRSQLGALKQVHFIWLNKDAAAFGWFRSLLQELEDKQTDPEFLRMRLYLTGRLDDDTVANLTLNDPGAEYDAVTGLRSRTYYGRPVWRDVFGELQRDLVRPGYLPGKEASLRTKVGVFYCGPGPLAKTLRNECKMASTGQVDFGFYKEHF